MGLLLEKIAEHTQAHRQSRQKTYRRDQARLINTVSKLYRKARPELERATAKRISKSPGYKTYRRKKVVGEGAALGGTAGLAAGIGGRSLKKGLIGAGIGAVAGAGLGLTRARKGLKRQSARIAKSETRGLLRKELKRNTLLHRHLAKPGIQRVEIKRPWGKKERYVG